jgi:hypothetical protein
VPSPAFSSVSCPPARHGDYAAARDAASRFFSDAAREVDSGELPAAPQSHLQSALADRDTIITLLVRGDPAGAERMTAMFVAYRGLSTLTAPHQPVTGHAGSAGAPA